jgi:hypothetical protein
MAYEDYSFDPMGNYTGYGSADYSVDEEERKRREEEDRKRREEEDRKQREAFANQTVHEQKIETRADGSQSITTVAERPPAPVAPQRPVQAVQAVRPAIPNMNAYNTSAYGVGAQQGRRYAADVNNPSGLGWNGQTWNSYATPEEGVAATQNQVGRYLEGQGPMKGKLPTIDNIVSTWVTGGRTSADQIQGGGYRNAVQQSLNRAGIQLGPNGEVPNTPEARLAITQAITSRETLPQHQGRFAQALGLTPPQGAGAGRGTLGMPQAMPEPGVAVATGQGVQGTTEIPEVVEAPVAPVTQEVTTPPAAQPQGPVEPYALTAPGAGAPGLKMPGLAGPQPTPGVSSEQHIQAYQDAQNDPAKLMAMGFDQTVPEWMRDRARNRAADLVTQDRNIAKAQQEIGAATPTELSRYLAKKTTEGSWGKFVLYGLLGMKTLQAEEATKLGMGHEKMVAGPDGKGYIIKFGLDGTPIEGYNSKGDKLNPEELVRAAAGSERGVKQSSMPFSDPTGTIPGSWVMETRPGETPIFRQVGGNGRVATADESAQLTKIISNKDQLQSARTQATHAYTAMLTKLNKDREQLVQLGATEEDLARRGLDEASIQRKANAAGQNVMTAATSMYGLGAPTGRAPVQAPISITTGQTKPTDMPAVTENAQQPAAAAAAPATNVPTTSGILNNWEKIRPGEDVANFKKRTQYTKEDIEAEAQQLVNGDKTLTEITGRDAGLLRHYASARAKEIDPSWSATDSNARRDALKKWTNPDSQVSKQVRSHITAANSIQDVKDAFTALQNGNLPLFNQIKNDFEKNTGKPLPISAETGAMMLGPEIIKSIIPNGGGVTERLEAKHLLNIKLSPAQAKAVFDELELFQGNSLKALETDWTRAKLPKDQFRDRVLGGSPAAQELYDRASKHQADRAAGKVGLQSAPSKAEIEAEMRRRGLLK